MARTRNALVPVLLTLVLASPASALQARPQATKPAAAQPAGAKPLTQTAKSRRSSGPLLCHGYACMLECSQLQEGYAWASAHEIHNPADCRGISETFIDGCRAFAGVVGPFGGKQFDPSFPHMIGIE
ncbi:MAG: hypothetical protein J0H61_06870 [Alphaproteobacteria bacterium]|nr:hypothetical protein [Alphaproteobacteria bacterium]